MRVWRQVALPTVADGAKAGDLWAPPGQVHLARVAPDVQPVPPTVWSVSGDKSEVLRDGVPVAGTAGVHASAGSVVADGTRGDAAQFINLAKAYGLDDGSAAGAGQGHRRHLRVVSP